MIKVLIADDQELIRSSIQIILEANPKFKVTATVADGEEVLDAIKKRTSRCYLDGCENAKNGRNCMH